MRYTREVGRKFHADRTAKTFPGNTIICFVDPKVHPTVFEEASWAQTQLMGMGCAEKFGFLPPSSFHMTVIELLTDEGRTEAKWSSKLPLDMPLEETDHFFIETLKAVSFDTSFEMSFQFMREQGTIAVAPATEASREKIWAFRRAVAEATGVCVPTFNEYKFHITLAYNLIELEPQDILERDETFARIDKRLLETFGTFVTDPPVLTFFDDMFKFVPAPARLSLHTRSF